MPINNYIDTIFGVSGDLTLVPDATQVDGTVSYTQGYPIGYETAPGNPGALPIERAKMNQLFNTITTILQQYQQQATPPFITTTMNGGTPYSYSMFNRVLQGGVVYQSIANSNTDTPPSSKWVISYPYNGTPFQTGMMMPGMNSTPFTGFINIDGNTIGSASSGATYNGTTYQPLYEFWWNNVSFPSSNAYAIVTGGLGASAAADFAANKPLTMPNSAGMAIVGVSSFFTQAGATYGALTVAAAGSNGSTGSTAAGLDSHTHTINIKSGQANSASLNTALAFGQSGGSGTNLGSSFSPDETNSVILNSTGSGSTHSHTGGAFTGSPTSVIQPSLAAYWQIAL
jgi:hypothetical protein